MDKLTSLNLSGTKVTDKGIIHLGRLSNLTLLNLDRTGLTDDGIATLVEMPATQGLRFLYFSGDNITDRGIEFLAKLKKLNGVDLSDTKITDKGLAPLKTKRLTWLNVGRTAVTQAAIEAFRAECPGTSVGR
jgi:internalin A